MITTHNLGFPRIGAKRELKFALETFWKGETSLAQLQNTAAQLRQKHWEIQSSLNLLPVGDFSLYDQVLDMSVMLGAMPERARNGEETDDYFRMARGRSANDKTGVRAGDLKKWFDTNYHYIVPELNANMTFQLNAKNLLAQIKQAKTCGITAKPVIIGPITYLWLGKMNGDKTTLLNTLLPLYRDLLNTMHKQGVEWVQIDEPALVTDLSSQWMDALKTCYNTLSQTSVKLLLTTYFGPLRDNLQTICNLPVSGLHLDAVRAHDEITTVANSLPNDKILSLGPVDGRNIWKSNLNQILEQIEPVADQLQERLWLAPSCSLLHVPVTLENETRLNPEIRNWMAFATQKLQEISLLAKALNHGRKAVEAELTDNHNSILSRQNSPLVHDQKVQNDLNTISPELERRKSPYAKRAQLQRQSLKLPLFPTTTIGSFPQTDAIRTARLQHRKQKISTDQYNKIMKAEISRSITEQEKLGLDVLVHGEAERNDMVEYFGQQLNGYTFTQSGWVQSYGSRCVKPPILYGDISRPRPMTLEWTLYAKSLTQKPMKGMLTGPVTILNWSFVRDDQPRHTTCKQLALAIRQEVLDLENAGISIIQIDEAALREGLPLRQSEWKTYLDWAIMAFRIAANGVSDKTQIHTHMCYSRFNDIIKAISHMDADVITIETSRSDMELLDAFDAFDYPNEIGPGVYDIHSPNTPPQEHIVSLMRKAARRIPPERLWINPDCGLKTRRWEEVIPALANMVSAAQTLRRTEALKP